MTTKKRALVTAGTGGVGGGLADFLLEQDWELFLPIRDMQKAQKYTGKENVHLTVVNDFTDQTEVDAYIRSIQEREIPLDLVALATGKWLWDDDKKALGSTPREKYTDVLATLKEANIDTKETFVNALISFYQDLHMTDLLLINSQARHFATTDVRRKNRPQEAYIFTNKYMDYWGGDLITKGIFRNVFNEYAPLVDTLMTREQLKDEPIDWSKAHLPLPYAAQLFTKLGIV